jgi:hypothetical protein
MIGTIMTAADAGIKELSIIGPPDTSHFLATCELLFRGKLTISLVICS